MNTINSINNIHNDDNYYDDDADNDNTNNMRRGARRPVAPAPAGRQRLVPYDILYYSIIIL